MLDTLTFLFMKYLSKHGKSYETVEEWNTRLEHFIQSHKTIEEQNASGSLFTSGHNQFSDWSQDEYESMLGLKDWMRADHSEMEVFSGVANSASLDWRDVDGAVTPVKDQGQCGSCWAFSATEAMESAYVIAGNSQVIMSPQEIVDCAKGLFSSHGCNGGWYYYAWSWLATHKSMTEADYPYTSGTTGQETSCAYDSAVGVTNVSSYVQVA
jgi:C1A family cysteine protease